METADKIRQARKKAGLTQKQLAEKLGFTAQNLAQYETGKRNPKFETLCKIANILTIPVEDLIDSISIGLMTEDDIKAIEYFQQSPEDAHNSNKNIKIMESLMHKLNNCGQCKAIEQAELLAKIPEYQKNDE